MLRTTVKKGALLSLTLAVGIWLPANNASAVSGSVTQIHLFAGKLQASVNTQGVLLEEPPVLINDHFYVPAKWLADILKLPLSWESETNTIQLLTSKAYIQFDPGHDRITVNGIQSPFHAAAEIRNGRLLVDVSWLALYTNIAYRYDSGSQSMELSDISSPANAYKESTLRKDDTLQNSRPIAKFAFGKSTYRLGEPIDYVDLSYDPDAEGLPDYHWTGKEDAFFKPGPYTVTLTVADGKGNQSEPFSKTITVLNVPFASEEQFSYSFKPVNSLFKKELFTAIPQQAAMAPNLPIVVSKSEDRRLIQGSSSAPIMEKGFLYQDKFTGRARLYPQYISGMSGSSQLAILVRNASETKPVQLATTAAADSQASVYTSLLGGKTAENFLVSSSEQAMLTLEPGAARFIKVSPELGAGQGFQGIYDLEADGEVYVSYAMIASGDQPYDLGAYRTLQLNESHNGSYPVSEVSWQIDANSLKSPIALRIGDSTPGEANQPNAGVRYRIRIVTSDKTAAALYPQGGFFEGAVKVNGSIASLPSTGLTSNEGILLYRSPGLGSRIDIELMAAGTTKLPVDLILYPLPSKQ
jgi:PKD repeat protein